MPVEPFAHQPQKHTLRRKLISEGDLILDDHAYGGMNDLVRKPNSLPPVVSDDQPGALGFIEREPSTGVDVLAGSYRDNAIGFSPA